MAQIDTFKTRTKLTVGGIPYDTFSLKTLATQFPSIEKLPFSLKVLLENLLRFEDGRVVKKEHVEALTKWTPKAWRIWSARLRIRALCATMYRKPLWTEKQRL